MKISILGCGWLGFPLAKSLISKNYEVKGSTTSTEKLVLLESENINPFLIELTEKEVVGDFESFLNNSEILIIDIPPKLRGNNSENFVQKIKNIIPFIENSSIKKVLFVSSTSVYEDSENTNLIVDENTIPKPETESGKQLFEAEKLLQSNSNFKTTIVRFGGLVGENRHPIRVLSGRKSIENPNGSINLIHQKDCVGIIEKILISYQKTRQNDNLKSNEVFNAVYPLHLSRKEYYSQKTTELNLTLPEFNEDTISKGKIILSDKISRVLDYKFTEKP